MHREHLKVAKVYAEEEWCACILITTRQRTKLKWAALAFTVLHTEPENYLCGCYCSYSEVIRR